MASRTWIKVYCDNWLSGSIRDEDPIVRSVFIDLLTLAGSGKYGDIGQIKLQNDVGFTDLQFKNLLKITKNQWLKSKKQLILTQRIDANGDNVLTIINWKKYQSEYERQRPYRNQKLQPEVTPESAGEIEKEIEIENKKKRNQALKKSPDLLNEFRMTIFEGLKERRGNNSPVPGAEATAITWMLKQGYTVEQILNAYDTLKKDPFWADKFLNLQSVKTQIGEIFKKGESRTDITKRMKESINSPVCGTSIERLKAGAK